MHTVVKMERHWTKGLPHRSPGRELRYSKKIADVSFWM